MVKTYQRDTAFLYPALTDCEYEQRMGTLKLIADLDAIVQVANQQLRSLIEGGSFSYVNCMPSVHMYCISEETEAQKGRDNIRICVTGFDDHDYTAYYQELTQKYRAGETEISHLVAVHLYTKQQRIEFSADKNNQFNAIIKTGMDYLKEILVAIMFDISIYHYFLLDNSLSERKKFNLIKYNFISNYYDAKDQETHYGTRLPAETSMYLPISLPQVKKIQRRIKNESRQEAVKEMLDLFATFIVKEKSLHITQDENGVILNPSDEIPQDIFSKVEEIVRKNRNSNEYAVIFFQNSPENSGPSVIEFDENGNLSCWISKEHENLAIQTIITVKQKG